MSRELLIHVVERVIGDAQGGQHLPAGSFAFALLLSLMPGGSTTQHYGQNKDSGETLPENGMALRD